MKPFKLPVLAALFALACPAIAPAQTPATLIDLGTNAPVPGPADIYQLSMAGNTTFPDGLNYYSDNQVSYKTGEPGQTFTTGNSVSTLSSLCLKSAGLDSGGGSPGAPINYVLHIYTVSGGSNAPLASYITQSPVGYAEGDWLRWTGLSVTLSANQTFAYSFGKATNNGGWDAIGVASGSPYAGGEIGLFLPAGGAITFGTSHSFDASFDVGLIVQTAPTASQPAVSPTNNPIYSGTPVTLTENALGQGPLFYQWRTDGGSGGSRTNIPGATASNLVVNTTGIRLGADSFDVVVSNAFGKATSSVAVLNLAASSAPFLVSDISPGAVTDFVGQQQSFSAVFNGTFPITYQWQANTGGGFTNIPNATNSVLVLSSLAVGNSGSYRLLASNAIGGPVASSPATLAVQSPPFVTGVIAANPVGYWRLNETGSTLSGTLTAADVMNNFPGVYGVGSADGLPGPTPSAGFPGLDVNNTAAQFANNVANSVVTVPALNLNANTVTITAWVYPIGTPADYSGIFFCRPGGDAAGLNFTDNGQLGYTWNQNNQNTWSWMSGLVPPQGQWSFVALVISPTNAIAYLCNTNGQSSATNTVAHTAEAFNGITLIGGDTSDGGNGSRTFNGRIDEVAVFNTSLSPPQVLNLYFYGAGGEPRVGPVTASPSNTVYSGTTVTLSAPIGGLAPFQYQWQTNGVNLPGATNAVLVLSDADVSNSGSYDLIVGNSSGTNESPALLLTVKPPGAPVFEQQPAPASATNYVGGLATFTAVVDGSPPIQLQWQRNGTSIPNATAASLTLASLQLAEAGSYTLTASNDLGFTNSQPALLAVLPSPSPSALNVLTYHNNNMRLGANTNEVLLTHANVNVSTFGLLINYPVDGYIYTQPLFVAGLAIPGLGTRNAVFVATEHNSVYAFDADSAAGPNGGVLWSTNLGTSALSSNQEFGDRYNGGNYTDIVPEVGITGTPVIDTASGTLYVDVRTRVVGASTNYYHSIHALNITNGAEQPYSPVIVTNSVPGTGVDSSNGVVTFNPVQENQRPGMTLAGGMLYVAYGSFADTDPYHGWVLGFNATNLQQSSKYVFNTTPNATVAAFGGNAGEGALWMGGNGLSVDASNNLYFETANGSFSANTNGGDYSDSFVRLTTSNGLAVADYFTPYYQLSLANSDSDLGSGGPLLLPDSAGSAAHPHLMVGAGKEGKIFLVDRDHMGGYSGNTDNDVQELPGAIGSAFSSPAYFNSQIYYQGSGDVMKAFLITNGVLVAAPVSQAGTSFSALGGTPSISANGTNEGIVWAIQSDAFASSGPAVLHAYNATNLAIELYNSSQNAARDSAGGAVQMTTPTVANGRVFVPGQYSLAIYGNSLFLATPVIAPAGGSFTNSITVSISDATPNSTIYYTLDGTAPTTNSPVYTGPFTLTTSATVQAIAAQPGAASSAIASAGFVDSSAIGTGAGLQGSYWANVSAAQFTNSSFNRTATLTRTDAVVNFNWTGSSGPSPAVGETNFAARWTGSIQPQYGETYTLTTVADDGVLLWVNGQLLISAWQTNSTSQTNSASITLKAQQLYSIQMDYFQNTGNAAAQLLWSSPSTPQAVIPQTQLYPYTNPPPSVALTLPGGGATFTADASISFTADADAPYNPLSYVSFYANGVLAGTASNPPYALTATGIPAGSYTLTASATDGSGLSSTSAPVTITVTAGSGQPYGLTTNAALAPFLNQRMPGAYAGSIPALLSQTGAYGDTPNRVPSPGLISYVPNTPLWSDGAVKSRYMGVPATGGPASPGSQIGFAPTGQWTFPAGTVFVKNFDLVVDETNPNAPLRRLETRLLVRDTNGAVYGVTYKWRPDNSDADLLTGSMTEAIAITNFSGVTTQNWYYPSPADCLTCHTPVASYVLGVNTRQLNGTNTYTSTGVTDNQLRTLNRLGLFYPAFDEAAIAGFEQLSSVTNPAAPLVQRARSYLDANCSQCHQPGGTGITFDARYDTPLTNQNLINAMAAFSLGYDNAKIVAPSDVWRSVLYDRMNTTDQATKMPPLARNTIDTNAVAAMAAWINSLGGTPALAPPVLSPASGIFTNSATLTIESPDPNAFLFYTLDGSVPTTNSLPYTGPFVLASSATVTANAFEPGFVNSVAVSGSFTIVPPSNTIFAPGFLPNGQFEMQYFAPAGQTYILQCSTNLVNWFPVATNVPASAPFTLVDPQPPGAPNRFYRVVSP